MNPVHSFVRKLEAVNAPEPLKHPLRVTLVLWHDLVRCDLMKQASAMAYVTLLSLIPSLVAIFCVLSLFSPLFGDGISLTEKITDLVVENLAAGAGQSAIDYLDKMLGRLSLAKIGWSSFASVLVTLVMLLRQIEEALNRIWLIRKGRNLFTRFMYFWTFLTLGIVVLAVGIGVTSGFDVQRIVSVEAQSFGSRAISWTVGFAGGFLFFFTLYKFVPNCFVAAKSAAMGAATSAFLLNQAGRIYGMYVKDAKNYQTLYGAMAQLPIFLMWLYICWIIILLGALVCWRMQEGFPTDEEEDTLDLAKSPLDQLRNVQVKSVMPLIALAAIYRNFQEGTGQGLSGQNLAHALKLPTGWVAEALDVLESKGYVVPAKPAQSGGEEGGAVTDPFFPAYPANALMLSKVHTDLGQPLTDWMQHWHHDVPLDIPRAIRLLGGVASKPAEGMTLEAALTAAVRPAASDC